VPRDSRLASIDTEVEVIFFAITDLRAMQPTVDLGLA
jgi:hypothetical protein